MFCRWKKLYQLAEERLKSQSEYLREVNKDKYSYDKIMENLKIIFEKYEEESLCFYFVGNNPYYITETRLSIEDERDYEIDLYTYKLTDIRLYPIAQLKAEIYFVGNLKKARISVLDTMQELRSGHGSKIIQRFLYTAKNEGVDIVWGKLLENTYIGLENLKAFYLKNGFIINEKKSQFSLVLKEPPKNDSL